MPTRLLLLLALLAPASAAQARKLNAPLAQGAAGAVASEPRVSADGRHVVYLADDDADGLYELFTGASDGSTAPVRLVEEHAWIVVLALDEVNRRVVYTHGSVYTQGSSQTVADGLFSVAVDGTGVPIELSGPLGPYETYGSAAFDASGSRLVYRRILQSTQPNAYRTFERLFSVPALGGAPPVELNEPLPPGRSVWLSQLTPDGSEVCFTVDDELGRIGLRAVPLDGSAPPRELPVPLPAAGDVLHFFLDPAGERVFYVADARVDELFELFSIALDGSEPPRTLVADRTWAGSSRPCGPHTSRSSSRARSRSPPMARACCSRRTRVAVATRSSVLPSTAAPRRSCSAPRRTWTCASPARAP